MLIESPIVAVVGNKGAGKTLFLTYRAEYGYYIEKRTIYSNFHLKNIPYKSFDFNMLVDLPEEMTNGIIVMDEAHMGADAYAFLSKKSKAISLLATQLRKRNLDLYISTQRFRFLASRLKELTDYIFTMEVLKDEENHIIQGTANVKIFDRSNPFSNKEVGSFIFDGREFFNHYDTKQVIL
jgi:hypothetical protein